MSRVKKHTHTNSRRRQPIKKTKMSTVFGATSPLYNRVQLSVPNYANPYNMPVLPEVYNPPCQSQYPETVGAIYRTAGGDYGNCSPNTNQNSALGGFDFVCPSARMCYSQTSPLVGFSPEDICCASNGSVTRKPYLNPNWTVWQSLAPVRHWRPQIALT